MDYKLLSEVNMALSDENRIKIIDMLSCKKMNAKQLLDCLAISQPTLSFHLNKLIKANVVTSSKNGTMVFYKLNQVKISAYKHTTNTLLSKKKECLCFNDKANDE